jgi:hypothetical protein
MPRTEKVLSVFLASPSDVQTEREIVEQVINEFNIAWSSQLGLRMELIRWETHVRPGFGADPQAVVNDQIPPDFDLFVGIMWHRFGTPTQRAASGTYEEFQLAKERWTQSPSTIDIMFYFKDEPVAPHSLDVEQLAQVQRFRKELGSTGVYASFSSIDEFERKIRSHLSAWAQKWGTQSLGDQTVPRVAVIEGKDAGLQSRKADELFELGMLECNERYEKDFAQMTDIMSELSSEINSLGAKLNDHTARIARIKREQGGNREMIKLALRDAANDLNSYAETLDERTVALSEIADDGLATLKRVILLWPSFFDKTNNAEVEQAHTAQKSLEVLRETLVNTRASMTSFQDSVDGTPPLSTDIIKAKGRVFGALAAHIQYLKNFETELGRRADELRQSIAIHSPSPNLSDDEGGQAPA